MKNIVAISIGAFFGAISRYFLSQFHVLDFPVATLFINVLGSFILCFIAEITIETIKIRTTLRHMVTTGFISSFTTFSTFVFETIKLMSNGELTKALIYPILSVLLGLLASMLGIELAEDITERQKEVLSEI